MQSRWRVPALWHEIGACFELGITYAHWLAQPAQHRALYLQYLDYKARMEAIEHQEMREKRRK